MGLGFKVGFFIILWFVMMIVGFDLLNLVGLVVGFDKNVIVLYLLMGCGFGFVEVGVIIFCV